MDFAKRKYRPGYYVNLSSNKKENLKIANAHSKELDKKIAELSPIISKKETSIPNSQLSILPSQFILSTPIKNNFQNVLIYNRKENRIIENNSSQIKVGPDAAADKNADPKGIGFFIFGIIFSLIVIIMLLEPTFLMGESVGLFGLAALLCFILYHVMNQKPYWEKKGLPKPEWKKQKFSMNATLSLLFSLTPAVILALLASLINNSFDTWVARIIFFGSFNLFAILAIVFALIAAHEFKKHPELGGRGLAVFGFLFGLFLTYFSVIFLLWTNGP